MTFLLRFTVYIIGGLQNYYVRLEARPHYSEIASPLTREVIDDICTKFELDEADTRCSQDSIAYAPDFFEDIRSYFKELPDQEANYKTAHEKLGKYLDSCELVNREESYRCNYYLGKVHIFPIGIYFNKEGYIFRIIANTDGS